MALDFPNSPSVNDSFSAGGKTWVYNGTKWVLLGVSLNQAVADGAITTAKIADSAITASKIADGTVVAAEIASDAITTAKILDANITAAKLASNAVTTAKILDANVTQAKLGTTLSAVTVTTAANRDTAVASPFTGQLVFLTDTKKIQVWDGTSWLNITLAPPETPTSLSATALSTTSVSVAFTAGGANGSPITNYKYALSTDSGSTYGSFTAVDPADITTPITISGLTQNTAYYIKLKAVNDMGDSVASAAVSITTLNLAAAPTSLSAGSITTTSVDISFTPGSQGGSAITNYQYAISTDSGSTYGSFTALNPADAASPITITGLTANTAYYVKIKAVNTEGAGAESSAVSFATLIAVSVDYLVLAGGGGGGRSVGSPRSGGGGAGGLRSTVTNTGGGGSLETALALATSTNYTVQVGAGGVGSANYAQNPSVSNGVNSVFSTITSTGGGGGGAGSVSGVGTPGTANLGGGGGSSGNDTGAAGGSGVVILRYPVARTITIGAGLTGTTATDGSYKVTTITAGTGNVSWA